VVIEVRVRISSQSHPIILSPIRGGDDYRDIYDIGLKGAVMGYRGLLLNDPYKRDRIDGCVLDIFRKVVAFQSISHT
jgi:hypothetical protein